MDRLAGGGRGLALQFIRTGLEHLGLTNSGVCKILKNFPGWSEDGLSHFTTEKPKVQKGCDSIAWVSSERQYSLAKPYSCSHLGCGPSVLAATVAEAEPSPAQSL